MVIGHHLAIDGDELRRRGGVFEGWKVRKIAGHGGEIVAEGWGMTNDQGQMGIVYSGAALDDSRA